MILTDLLKYNDIIVQIHDNPDADAVGSGYAIYRYFQDKGKQVRLVYGGRSAITKTNMLLMLTELQIPIEYVTSLDKPELLITVDGQYGEGNMQKFEAENIAMIDHHNTGRYSDEMTEIRSHLVSCATICYALLKEAGYDVNKDVKLATALFYGLFMDSNQLSEINHPYDRDMIEFLQYDRMLISRLKYANLNMSDFETAGWAILSNVHFPQYHYALIKAKECDPNLLGVIGDFSLQVDSIDVCVIYCENPGGYKLSVRSCIMEVAANELAGFLVEGIGNGGGHLDKAGGFIGNGKYTEKYGTKKIEEYFTERMNQYYAEYEVIHYSDAMKNPEKFGLYRKKSNCLGYVKSIDLYEAGTECRIRTLEGDVFVNCGEDIYIMIGPVGEVYPITAESFAQRYDVSDMKYDKVFDYAPSAIKMGDNTTISLLPYARSCISKPGAAIWAKQVDIHTKVFNRWNYETYMNAKIGDWLCYSTFDDKDVYVVQKEIFGILYEKVE